MSTKLLTSRFRESKRAVQRGRRSETFRNRGLGVGRRYWVSRVQGTLVDEFAAQGMLLHSRCSDSKISCDPKRECRHGGSPWLPRLPGAYYFIYIGFSIFWRSQTEPRRS